MHTESRKPPKMSPHGRMFHGLNESLKHWVEVQYLKRKPHAVSLRNLIKVQCGVIARAVTAQCAKIVHSCF